MPIPVSEWPIVLLIDDAPHTAEIITSDLVKDGINVRSARTLDEGFELALKIHPCLIVVDYKFNGADGIDFAQRLREDARLADIPRILITEREVDFALRLRALNEGYLTCVQKPTFDRSWAQLFRSFMR